MKNNKHNYKVTDEQFIEAYRASEGNFSQTAKYIREHFNIPYTNQSAQERALNHPEETERLLRIMDNESLTTIMNFADDITLDIKLRARMYVQVMININRRDRLKMQLDKAKAKQPVKAVPEGVFQIGDYILRFPKPGDPPETEEQLEEVRRAILAECAKHTPPDPKPDAPL